MKSTRIEALNDGIFAIVMTLLILDIHTPKIGFTTDPSLMFHELSYLVPNFLTYVISFILLGVFWIGHQNQYQFIHKTDRLFLWINIVFFMFVGLIPFSAALLSEYYENQVSVMVYGLNLICVGLMLFFHWYYAVKKNLIKEPLDANFVKMVNFRILIGPFFYFIALLISFFNPTFSLICFVIPVIFQILPGSIDRFMSMFSPEG